MLGISGLKSSETGTVGVTESGPSDPSIILFDTCIKESVVFISDEVMSSKLDDIIFSLAGKSGKFSSTTELDSKVISVGVTSPVLLLNSGTSILGETSSPEAVVDRMFSISETEGSNSSDIKVSLGGTELNFKDSICMLGYMTNSSLLEMKSDSNKTESL